MYKYRLLSIWFKSNSCYEAKEYWSNDQFSVLLERLTDLNIPVAFMHRAKFRKLLPRESSAKNSACALFCARTWARGWPAASLPQSTNFSILKSYLVEVSATSLTDFMDSSIPECTEIKHNYEKCFNEWFSKEFLKGNVKLPEQCDTLFKDYQRCIRPKLEQYLDT